MLWKYDKETINNQM